MKTQTLVALAAFMMIAGCASQNSGSNDPSTTVNNNGTTSTTLVPGAPVGTSSTVNSGVTGYSSGSTASLTLNGSALSRMFYNSNPTAAANPRINIDLRSNTEAVIVSYVENGVLHEATFGTQHPNNSTLSNASYNGWVSNVWKGFFQDSYGAVVLVLDKAISQSDGTSSSILGGSLWFQNFQQSNAQNPVQGYYAMCWQITRGPYDCRSFLVSNSVNVTSSLYPTTYGPDKTAAYEKLGDFGGIDRTTAGF